MNSWSLGCGLGVGMGDVGCPTYPTLTHYLPSQWPFTSVLDTEFCFCRNGAEKV